MNWNDPNLWGSGLDLLNKALAAVKAAKDLLPTGPKKQAIESAVEEARKALQLAEARIASELDYELCRCTFPPQVMLSKAGANPTCSLCGNTIDRAQCS